MPGLKSFHQFLNYVEYRFHYLFEFSTAATVQFRRQANMRARNARWRRRKQPQKDYVIARFCIFNPTSTRRGWWILAQNGICATKIKKLD